MKKINMHKILIHIYVNISVLAAFVLLNNQQAGRKLYTIGAFSWWIALGVSGAENAGVSAFLVLWVVIFPILLFIFYFMACKKEMYTPFCVIAIIDAAISLLWAIHCRTINDVYALQLSIPDAVISPIYAAALTIVCVLAQKKRKTEDFL